VSRKGATGARVAAAVVCCDAVSALASQGEAEVSGRPVSLGRSGKGGRNVLVGVPQRTTASLR
jgi:hypothetical protein